MAAPHVAGVAALVRQADPGAARPRPWPTSCAAAPSTSAPPASTRPRAPAGVDALRAVEAAVGPAPDTRFTVDARAP